MTLPEIQCLCNYCYGMGVPPKENCCQTCDYMLLYDATNAERTAAEIEIHRLEEIILRIKSLIHDYGIEGNSVPISALVNVMSVD